MGEEKMAKSGDNFITLQTLRDKNIDPMALRYVFLGARYSSPLQFSWEALVGAQVALKKLREKINSLPENVNIVETKFLEYVNDDLDTAKSLALVWDILKDENISDADKKSTILDFDKVLGLQLDKVENFVIPDNVQNLINQRNIARNSKDFAKSDKLRAEIENLGFEIKDAETGTLVTPK
jgi:cysteinyl-tRNA synthetase